MNANLNRSINRRHRITLVALVASAVFAVGCGTIARREVPNSTPVYEVSTNSGAYPIIKVLSDVNSAVPTPFTGAINLALATALAGLAAYAKIRTARAAREADAMKEAIEASPDAPNLKNAVARKTSTVVTK